MKLLIVADIHYSLKQYDWLVAQSPYFDCVVVAGDLLDIASGLDQDVQAVAVIQYLAKLSSNTKVIACSGNHDGNWNNEDGELEARWLQKARYEGVFVDGDCIEFGDYLISVYPWWNGPGMQKQIAEQIAQNAKRRQDKWIWIYHAPPKGSPISWSGKNDWGDKCVQGWIKEYEPDIIFSGHVHQSPFVKGGSWHDRIDKTWVFNGGREPGYLPTHLIFDTDKQEILWYSSEGPDSLSLEVS